MSRTIIHRTKLINQKDLFNETISLRDNKKLDFDEKSHVQFYFQDASNDDILFCFDTCVWSSEEVSSKFTFQKKFAIIYYRGWLVYL